MSPSKANGDVDGGDDRLDRLLRDVWSSLEEACRDRRSAFRNVAVATVDDQGHPHGRIVVLRRVDSASRTVEFHTDVRSAKVRELERTPAVELLFWDPDTSVQIRVAGRAELHTPGSEEASTALAPIPQAGRAKYRADPAPGTAIASPSASIDAPEAAIVDRFTLVRVHVATIDYLRLTDGAQRRARFDLRGGSTAAAWISP